MSTDKRAHRGPDPRDQELFAPSELEKLRAAGSDLAFLLTRSYSLPAALKLVGDRFRLKQRQRLALQRGACSKQAREHRTNCRRELASLRGETLWIDGFNIIVTIEAALGGGILIRGHDQCLRDLSSVHGSYRQVEETTQALNFIGRTLQSASPASVRWLLDRPVSNSGRLATFIRELAEDNGWPWEATLVMNPDAELARISHRLPARTACVATSDSVILDRTSAWVPLVGPCIREFIPDAWIVSLTR